MQEEASIMVVMVSNGPGELSTWVKPLAEKIHSKLLMRPLHPSSNIAMRLVLLPCPNATGKEKEVADQWGQFDKITSAQNFWKLLINPRKYGSWPSKGLVIFLGGDQFWSVLLSARLGYLNTTYAEWIARWPSWNDQIFAMSKRVQMQLPRHLQKRCKIVGDLMADINSDSKKINPLPSGQWIALMPGSKKAKLSIGIPFFLEVADHLAKLLPNSNFLLPVAPTTNINEFIKLSSSKNPISKQYCSGISQIINEDNNTIRRKLITLSGTEIHLEESYPAHQLLSQCDLALTTVGANTAELAALGTPMIVIIPTQHINVMQAWDGFMGILGRLPFLKKILGVAISFWRLRKKQFMAWPNISAGRMIVPERIGKILPKEVAIESYSWLNSPEKLEHQRQELKKIRGPKGAIEKLTNEIIKLIDKI